MHSKTTYIVAYVRDIPKRPATKQRERMTSHGIRKIYTDLDLLVRQRLPGDVVAVDVAVVLANPKDAKKTGGLLASALRTITTLARRDVTIWQLEGDLHSSDPKQADAIQAMLVDTVQRRRYQSTKRGRKPAELTPQQRAIIEPIWYNVAKYDTNEDAAKAIAVALKKAGCPRKLSAAVLLKARHMGPSGRGRVKSKLRTK